MKGLRLVEKVEVTVIRQYIDLVTAWRLDWDPLDWRWRDQAGSYWEARADARRRGRRN